MMQEAEHLVAQKLHPQTVISGWRKAVDEARRALVQSANDNGCVFTVATSLSFVFHQKFYTCVIVSRIPLSLAYLILPFNVFCSLFSIVNWKLHCLGFGQGTVLSMFLS